MLIEHSDPLFLSFADSGKRLYLLFVFEFHLLSLQQEILQCLELTFPVATKASRTR